MWSQWVLGLTTIAAALIAVYYALNSYVGDKDDVSDHLTQKLDVIIELLRKQTEVVQRLESSVVNGNRELRHVNDASLQQLKLINGEMKTQTELEETMSSLLETSSTSLKSLASKLTQKPTKNVNDKSQAFEEKMLSSVTTITDKASKFIDRMADDISDKVKPSTTASPSSSDTGARMEQTMSSLLETSNSLKSLASRLTQDPTKNVIDKYDAFSEKMLGSVTTLFDKMSTLVDRMTDDIRPTGTVKPSTTASPSSESSPDTGAKRADVGPRRPWSKSEPSLLVGNGKDIRQTNAATGQQHVICDVDVARAVAVDFDNANNAVFWTDVTNQNITRAVLDANGVLLLRQTVVKFDVLVPDGIAYDWVHHNLYWTDTGSDRIEVLGLRSAEWMNYDVFFHEVLHRRTVISTNLDQPRAIVVDPRPKHRMMYWTDWGIQAKIERASLDGSDRQLIVNKDVIWPNGLTIDLQSDRLFWVDAKLFTIYSSNLDGTDRRSIFKSHNHLSHPFSIAVFKGHVYWTDWHSQSVFKIQHDRESTTADRQVWRVAGALASPFELKLVHSSKQPPYADVCAEAKCSNLCLPSARKPSGYTCACPDNIHGYRVTLDADQRTCRATKVGRLAAKLAADVSMVNAVTPLNDVILVVRDESQYVDVYDSHSHRLLRRVLIKELQDVTDMTSSARHRCVYIADYKSKVVFRLTPDTWKMSKWTVGDDGPFGLSVTSNHNVLVTCPDTRRLKEFTTDGRLVREIVLERNITSEVWHAVELSPGRFAVSYGGYDDSVHKVCVVNALGQIGSCYGGSKGVKIGQLELPVHLTMADGSVLVACLKRRQVIQLSPTMNYVGTVLSDLDGPFTMYYDEELSRLYVADNTYNRLTDSWHSGSVKLFDISLKPTDIPGPTAA